MSDAFVELADTLVDDYDIIDLLDRLVAHCVHLLTADAVGLLLADGRRELRVVVASGEDAETMELLRLQADEGPCMGCFATSLWRWPRRWSRRGWGWRWMRRSTCCAVSPGTTT